jgi:manganese-dependent ADP-ribose/CDP-alcohol diphosphatase
MAELKLENGAPFVNAIGNHELYNFSQDDLRRRLGMPHEQLTSGTARDDLSTRPLYYSFSPHPGWRIIMLNGYEVSTALPAGSKGRIEAEKLIRKNHPHAEAVLNGSVSYFKDLSGMDMRFVPFNGGFGAEQLSWFRETLETARWRGERVIVLTHMPIHPMACNRQAHDDPASARTLPYDGPEAHRLIWECGRGCVVAVLAGHAHDGGHYTEPNHADHNKLLNPLPGEPAPKGGSGSSASSSASTGSDAAASAASPAPAASVPAPAPPSRSGLHHLTIEAALTHEHAYG